MRILITVSLLFLLTNLAFGYVDDALCQPGTFSTMMIPNGQTNPITICEDCSVGRFQDEPGKSACKDCPEGTFQDKKRQTACEPCLAGTYQPNTRAENCLLCEIGRYQNLEGAEMCKECPPGMTTRERGSMSESACVPIDGKLPAMNRWGLFLLIGLVLSVATYLLRRSGVFN